MNYWISALFMGYLLLGLMACTDRSLEGPVLVDARTVAVDTYIPSLRSPTTYVFIRHFHYYRSVDQSTILYSGDTKPETLLDKVLLYALREDRTGTPTLLAEMTNSYESSTQEVRGSVSTTAPVFGFQGDSFILFNLEGGPIWGMDFESLPEGIRPLSAPCEVVNTSARLIALSPFADSLAYVSGASRLYVADVATGTSRLIRDFSPDFITFMGWQDNAELSVQWQRNNRSTVQRISVADGTILETHPTSFDPTFGQRQLILTVDRLVEDLPLSAWGMPSLEEALEALSLSLGRIAFSGKETGFHFTIYNFQCRPGGGGGPIEN